MIRAYKEIIEYLTEREPAAIADCHPSEQTLQRVRLLLGRSKSGELTRQESAELDEYLELEAVMRLAKARALARLADRDRGPEATQVMQGLKPLGGQD